MSRLVFGRLSAYLEPRDIWVGVYVAPLTVYVCPLPMVVLRWERCLCHHKRDGTPGPDGTRACAAIGELADDRPHHH